MQPVSYPSGICVGTETGNWFYLKGNVKIPITSSRVLLSWNFNTVIPSSEEAISRYKLSSNPLGFRDGSLLKNFADGKMYVVSGNKIRHITNPDWMSLLNIKDYHVIEVSDDEIKIHDEGDVLD